MSTLVPGSFRLGYVADGELRPPADGDLAAAAAAAAVVAAHVPPEEQPSIRAMLGLDTCPA